MTISRTTLFVIAAALLVAAQVTMLHALGRTWIAADGVVRLWEGHPFSVRTSQELTDWYSFSHIIHGFIFYGVLTLVAPRLPLGARLLIAMGVEVSWEMAENSPFVIEAYRRQALAAGYVGDSILNSVSDTVMMCTGFLLASRLRARWIVALALCFELFTAVMIRDGLFFNILNFALPLQAVHDWQSGAPR
jgi:hypothetical protein